MLIKNIYTFRDRVFPWTRISMCAVCETKFGSEEMLIDLCPHCGEIDIVARGKTHAVGRQVTITEEKTTFRFLGVRVWTSYANVKQVITLKRRDGSVIVETIYDYTDEYTSVDGVGE